MVSDVLCDEREKMVISSILLMRLIYAPPPSLYMTTMSVIIVAFLINVGFMEIKGKHMQYSKFINVGG